MRTWMFLAVFFISQLLHAVEGRIYTDPKTGIRLVSAPVELSAEGWWYVDPADSFKAPLGYTILLEPEDAWELFDEDRARALELRKVERERKQLLWRIYWNLRNGDGGEMSEIREIAEGESLHIRPDIATVERRAENRVILALELEPMVEDGKHWILWNDGTTERVDIDTERWKKEGLTVEPDLFAAQRPESFTYTLHAHVLDPALKTLTVTLKNEETEGEKEITVTFGGTEGQREDFTQWAEMRVWSWMDLDNRITDLWLERAPDLYGLDPDDIDPVFMRNDRGNTTSMLGVLGGGAAIRETLQMQNLLPGDAQDADPSIPVDKIPGVTVKAHGYADLLGDAPGKTVDLAKLCPPDRFWLYAPDPAALEPLLDGGADWLGTLQGGLAGLQTDQQVLTRHLTRLGLTEPVLRQILKSGIIGETAVMLPDLFLLDGTDVTCVARIRNLPAVGALFQARGIGPSPDPQTFTTRDGYSVTWAMRDDLFIIGTHAAEVDQVLALHANQGEGSLGETAEFRYMLTQCGPGEHTRLFAYFSDPFIRRLTGPAVKIGQYRRLMARADLERIHAGSLLYRQDTGADPESLKALMDSGYAGTLSLLKSEEVTFKDGVASHSDWGAVNAMPTLLETLPELATPTEAQAYRTYRQNYEQFWRQFFDPIAIHVEVPEADTYETTVFVLPLINSSIYDQIRQVLSSRGPIQPLPRPKVEPAPIAMLSLNLAEENWLDIMEGLSGMLMDTLGIDLPIWEHLGPGVHIAVADSDSILTFGSGELAGLFSGSTGMRGSEMVLIPMVATLFTRPAMVAVELDRPELALEKLRRMGTGSGWEMGMGGDFKLDMVRVSGRDRWLIRISIANLLSLNFSMEVQDGYLVISNLPMTYRPVVQGRIDPALHHAAAWFNPAAADQTRRAFAGAALAQAREGAQKGLGVLHAFHWSGTHEVAAALEACRTLFGFAPVHPAPGTFVNDPEGPESDTFGFLFEGRQPVLESISETYGLFPFIDKLDVTFQLENEGFRARIRWKLKTPEQP